MEYYVYICKVNGKIKYVGMGKGVRYRHCNSGKSSCAELNRDFFEGKHITVDKVREDLTKESAAELEKELINKYNIKQELYNKSLTLYRRAATPVSNYRKVRYTLIRKGMYYLNYRLGGGLIRMSMQTKDSDKAKMLIDHLEPIINIKKFNSDNTDSKNLQTSLSIEIKKWHLDNISKSVAESYHKDILKEVCSHNYHRTGVPFSHKDLLVAEFTCILCKTTTFKEIEINFK